MGEVMVDGLVAHITGQEVEGILHLEVQIADPSYPWLQAAFVYVFYGGTLELDQVRVSRVGGEAEERDPEIQVRQLMSQFPWARWENAARTSASEYLSTAPDQNLRYFVPRVKPLLIGSPGPNLAEVAQEYRRNVKKGLRDPVAQIARNHGVKPGTARAWVHRARTMGLLGPARGPTSGEAGPVLSPERAGGAEPDSDTRPSL
jgi:hypothetical protein